jgi:hypothetical protein
MMIAGFETALSPYVLDFENTFGVHPLVCCCITSIIALPFIRYMPETKGRKMLD